MDSKTGDLSQPTRVGEGGSEDLRLAQHCQDSLVHPPLGAGPCAGQSEINGLLAHVTLLWQMRQGTERLLESSATASR